MKWGDRCESRGYAARTPRASWQEHLWIRPCCPVSEQGGRGLRLDVRSRARRGRGSGFAARSRGRIARGSRLGARFRARAPVDHGAAFDFGHRARKDRGRDTTQRDGWVWQERLTCGAALHALVHDAVAHPERLDDKVSLQFQELMQAQLGRRLPVSAQDCLDSLC